MAEPRSKAGLGVRGGGGLCRDAFCCSLLVLALAATFVVGAAPKKVIYHYHWTETIYDVINANAVKMFMAKNPGVEVKMVLLPDGDRPNIIRTVLAANGIDRFLRPEQR